MTLHNHLQKLLIANCLSKVKDGSISLKGGQGKNQYPVKLTGMDTKNISVINLGKGPHSSLISKDGGYNKICDYLILIPKQNGKAVALFCELKKTYKQTGGMEIELAEMLGRKVDLRTPAELSRYFRDDVLEKAKVEYAI